MKVPYDIPVQPAEPPTSFDVDDTPEAVARLIELRSMLANSALTLSVAFKTARSPHDTGRPGIRCQLMGPLAPMLVALVRVADRYHEPTPHAVIRTALREVPLETLDTAFRLNGVPGVRALVCRALNPSEKAFS